MAFDFFPSGVMKDSEASEGGQAEVIIPVCEEKAKACQHNEDDNHDVPSMPPSSNNKNNDNNDSNIDDPQLEATYINLLRTNREYRLYLLGYLSALLGEWLTYIASISLIEEILASDDKTSDHHPSRTYVSILVVVRLLPSVLLSPFAGALADSRDKRQSMMALDVIGIVVPWLYLVALQRQSLGLIYGVTLLKYSLGALYEPSMMSIIPLMVEDEHYLKKAVTLVEGLWSVMAGVGSAIGGLVVAYYGLKTCFGKTLLVICNRSRVVGVPPSMFIFLSCHVPIADPAPPSHCQFWTAYPIYSRLFSCGTLEVLGTLRQVTRSRIDGTKPHGII